MTVKDQKFEPKAPDVIRQEVINDFGFDPEDDNDAQRIEKLTTERIERQEKDIKHHEKLSKAIAQKIKAKQQLDSDDDDDDTEDPKGTVEKKNEQSQTNAVTAEQLEARLHRERYPNLSDEEYTSINALALSTGKTFEDTIENNPIAKTYFESAESKARLDRVYRAPSSRSVPADTKTEEDKIAEELDTNLPEGFTTKKE